MNAPIHAHEVPESSRAILKYIGSVLTGEGRTEQSLAVTFGPELARGLVPLLNAALVKRYKAERGWGYEITREGRAVLEQLAKSDTKAVQP